MDYAGRISKHGDAMLRSLLTAIMHRMLITGEPFRWPPKQTPDPSPRQARATA